MVLFELFYRSINTFLQKIWNNFIYKSLKSYLILDLNLFSTSWLNYGNLDDNFKNLSFLKKYLLSVYPDLNHPNYVYSNNNVVYLSNFRKKYFPVLNEIVEFNSNFPKTPRSNYKFNKNNFSLKTLNKIGNFSLSFNFFPKNLNYFLSKNKNLSKSKRSLLYGLYMFFYFISDNFYFFLTYKHFFNIKKRNFTKFYFIFILFLKKLNKASFIEKYEIENLSQWFDFNNNNLNFFKKDYSHLLKNYSDDSFIEKYKQIFLSFNNFNFFKTFKVSRFYLKDTVLSFFKIINYSIRLDNSTLQKTKINFSESSTNKHIDLSNNFLKRSNFIFFFLRKNKIFNKGRYSRNRQTYRTGFYWCLWVNIFAIYGLHYMFYRFTFTFGYLWLFLIIFFGSFLFSRSLKYNFINIKYVYNELISFSNWCGFLFLNIFNVFSDILKFFSKKLNILVLSKKLKNNVIFKSIYLSFFDFYVYIVYDLKNLEHIHIWQYLYYEDESFIKYLSKIFFLKQFWNNFKI